MTAEHAGRVQWARYSRGWAQAFPTISVVVATHNRGHMLAGLVDSIVAQDTGDEEIELIVVDDGSTDDTQQTLERLVDAIDIPFMAVTIKATGGPSAPRNVGASLSRSPYLLFTDDDCLPTPRWARALHCALASGDHVVQGRTTPPPLERPGPWARAIWVEQPGPLFETCNIGYRKASFDQAGGFPLLDLVHHRNAPRGFGEDAALGCAVARLGRRGWAPEALVHHRWLPGTFGDHLRERRRLVAFPGLARAVPEVADRLTAGVFLSRRTLRFDAAIGGAAVAIATRTAWPALAALPWIRQTARQARVIGATTPGGLARLAVADAVGLASLLSGSVRSRRLIV